MRRRVPILATLDVHSYPHWEKQIPRWLEDTLALLGELSIRATFFFPAVHAERFAAQVRHLAVAGHEIGCHGLTHDSDEQFSLLPWKRQHDILMDAKARIEAITGLGVTAFRAPLFKINGDTIRALVDCGFRSDSSVNSQRLGLFSSDISNVGWLRAPRKPYHPDFRDPFRAGNSSLWELPVSAFVFPFMSNTGVAFGNAFMRFFLRMLRWEAQRGGSSLVYMFHPEDVVVDRDKPVYKFQWRHLLPSRKFGIQARFLLYQKNPEHVARHITGFLRLMRRTSNLDFLTSSEMVSRLDASDRSRPRPPSGASTIC